MDKAADAAEDNMIMEIRIKQLEELVAKERRDAQYQVEILETREANRMGGSTVNMLVEIAKKEAKAKMKDAKRWETKKGGH